MNLKYGDLFFFEAPYYGYSLLMVVNPPVVCWNCGCETPGGWDRDEDGYFQCPRCGFKDESPERKKGSDVEGLVSLALAANADTGEDSPNDTPIYNFRVNHVFTVGVKSLEADVKAQKARLCSKEEAFERKCLMVWRNTDGYSAGAPVPEWIKEMIRDEFPDD